MSKIKVFLSCHPSEVEGRCLSQMYPQGQPQVTDTQCKRLLSYHLQPYIILIYNTSLVSEDTPGFQPIILILLFFILPCKSKNFVFPFLNFIYFLT